MDSPTEAEWDDFLGTLPAEVSVTVAAWEMVISMTGPSENVSKFRRMIIAVRNGKAS